ncbi:MAG TPA: glycoside hydrolase family 88 protein [Puia sp.]|nr:glycoside hydrolase family 88 protein [Puia sp.]
MRQIIFCLVFWPVAAVHGQRVAVKKKATAKAGYSIDVAKGLAATVMGSWKDSGSDMHAARWSAGQAVVWLGLMRLWYSTGDAKYYRYVKQRVDRLVDKDGNIFGYHPEGYDLDNIAGGRVLLELYEVTLDPRYYKAATRLRGQLSDQPRTAEGSFWNKKKSPRQVRLEGVYMVMPFWAQYAALFHEDSVFDDIAHQFAVSERHVRDPKTGLLYSGWDESGHSPALRARAMGWYGMALVGALDYFPKGHPGRDTLLGILGRYAAAVRNVQDRGTGLWLDVMNKPEKAGNSPEGSASAMFIYTFRRGVQKGYLPADFMDAAGMGFMGILNRSRPYRDGVGVLILAAVEGGDPRVQIGHGKTVLLDYYFNNERRKDITGVPIRYHYTWEDRANSGFSLWGHLFRQYGAHTDTLDVAPAAEDLRRASVYIIVDPDDDREVPEPHYLEPAEIGVIHDWVKGGGVLVLMSNDSANAEFGHFNKLAGTFGIQFNYDDYHKVIGNRFEMGAFTMPGNDTIFKTTHKVYIKELSTLSLSPPGRAHFTDDGHVIMAVAKIGKGTVFAVGDPWFYNEYTDGRKLPPDFENYNAARDLAQWLLRQAHG